MHVLDKPRFLRYVSNAFLFLVAIVSSGLFSLIWFHQTRNFHDCTISSTTGLNLSSVVDRAIEEQLAQPVVGNPGDQFTYIDDLLIHQII